MSAVESHITNVFIVCFTVGSGADQINDQCSSSLAYVWAIPGHRWIPRTKGQ